MDELDQLIYEAVPQRGRAWRPTPLADFDRENLMVTPGILFLPDC